jgi:hypothetical protein
MPRASSSDMRPRIVAWIKGHDQHWDPTHGSIEIQTSISEGGEPAERVFVLDYTPWNPKLAPETSIERSAESLANEIVEAAEEHANERREVTRYVCTGDKDYSPKGIVFTVHPSSASQIDPDGIVEGASERGMQQQHMRLLEASYKLTLGNAEIQLENLRRIIQEQRKEIQDLYHDRRESMKLYEELLSERHVRDMQIRQIENEEKRMSDVRDMIAPLAPLVANKLLGATILKSKEYPPLEMARQLFATMNEEQMKSWLATLHPSQQAVALELMKLFYKEHQEKMEAEKAKREAREQELNGHGGPSTASSPTEVNVEAKDVTPSS